MVGTEEKTVFYILITVNKETPCCLVSYTTEWSRKRKDNYVPGGNDIPAETRGQSINAKSGGKRIPGKKKGMYGGHGAGEN